MGPKVNLKPFKCQAGLYKRSQSRPTVYISNTEPMLILHFMDHFPHFHRLDVCDKSLYMSTR